MLIRKELDQALECEFLKILRWWQVLKLHADELLNVLTIKIYLN